MNNKLKGILYISFSAMSFGFMPIFAKLAYKSGAGTFEVLFLRFTIAVIILLFYLKLKKIDFHVTKYQLSILIILGLFGYCATTTCLFLSYKYIPVGLATSLMYIYPVIVTIFSIVLYSEKTSLYKILALFSSVCGVTVMTFSSNGLLSFKGIFLALMSSIFYSFYVLGASNKEIKKINSFLMTFYISIISAVGLFVIGITTNNMNLNNINAKCLIYITLLSIISTVIALMTFLEGVRLIGPSKASIISTLEPLVSIISGYLILNEKISIKLGIGSFLVILSVIILMKESVQPQ